MKRILFLIGVVTVSFGVTCAADVSNAPVETACNGARTMDWKAWTTIKPVKAVHVKARARVNTGGWTAVLKKRTPQGSDPSVLLLDLQVTPPSGPAIQVITDLDVSYEETNTVSRFSRVQVFCGDSLTADVLVTEEN